ncbi:hypothetical protein [Actinomadura oligospora]|uniref:hypothetical protein n=1 Tax=Actinomadura oligospora TaxID=111804 RepID=UPI001B802383|nr:hypothetical protein [Actinomadura oligospora]
MATDGWQQARAGAVTLWRRVHPERVAAVEAELEEVRGEVLAARQASDHKAEDGLAEEWRRKLARLVTANPTLGAEIQQVLDQVWLPLLPEADQARVQRITMNATASGHGRVYQAGRDQTINEQ